ncbi:hypothetical protein DSO57_1001482 [Entomophthora muscae]|uniref:Uncharacterized protein n=1 Tax=Entomophthora muscae TaxID=34485 RepID=A0ACC2UV56_9FUNG|nr:hypothetical protein DSO57_1001482 [Entomophthora muscae]
MPRRSRSNSPSRTQTRSSSTSAARPSAAQSNSSPPHNQAGRQPGLFGQMASIAGGVAVGSTVGNLIGSGLSSMFGGGDSNQAPQQGQTQNYNQTSEQHASRPCEQEIKAFTECIERSSDISTCQVYYDMVKQCGEFVKRY